MISRFTIIAAVLCTSATTAAASEATSKIHYETHVRAILKKHCFHCHGEEPTLEGGLDVRLVRFLQQGGDSGAAIVPGQPENSLLLQRLVDGEMPPDKSKLLNAAEIQTIRQWIVDGAQTARPEPEQVTEESLITEEERSHWAFQPLQRPDVPTVQNASANPIDAFLLSKLEASGFGFSARANAQTLVRRLYLDLHGLPPTPEAVAQFESNSDAAAFAALVDQLLQDPAYGERWGRHWLDVAGYADSEGYNDADSERPDAWRYRDYVIQSFNDNKPFDRFIHEQLAGDEMVTSPINNLSPEDVQLLTATGFLRMAPDGTGGSVDDANVARNDTIADTIKIVSSSLMGMTVGCAQCHDHRYDPISQADYYRFRAIFEPAFDWQKWRNPAQRRISLYTDADREAAAKVEDEAKKIDAQRTAQQTEFINATFEKQLAKLPAEIHEIARAGHTTPEKDRTEEQKALLKKHPSLNVTAGSLYLYDQKAADELKKMADEAAKLRATKPKQEYVRALTEVPDRIPASHLFFRGDHEQPKEELPSAGLTIVSATAAVTQIPVNDQQLKTSGRRLALANRLTDPRHPLTARTIVNRVWMHHFGRGLVPTPSDFGFLGQPPTHPELLTWLAVEFIESGWNLKKLHALILTSNAWQQQLASDEKLLQADPDNKLYGGSMLRRLDAEIIRDCMLAISGKLNSKRFGPPVPVMADRVGRFVIGKENLNAGRPGDVIDMKGEEFRRSVYVQVRRTRPLSMLEAFDSPVMTPNCELRRPSTSSTQSLMMINSDLLLGYSRDVAQRLQQDAADNAEQQIQRAWQLIYSRSPEHSEAAMATKFLEDQTAIFAAQPAYQPKDNKPPQISAAQEALALMCQMLLGSNEFLYVD